MVPRIAGSDSANVRSDVQWCYENICVARLLSNGETDGKRVEMGGE